ncbi:protein-L-isoaspartate O-methyltransferase family protein [Aliirhizobium smilacinae]|uniref:Protein-L-isoaspartate O-methyltransferase n=1 Tax=Aliirhizobium smilacinae TaxID=1395944 RepID=A0A5C4XNX0_9HYPH|nr:protein-L-isoaspartate O-methyltransferase [Rhizobium smilacinae]TNM65038.1 protein-L-isoaspartate O-methyltransferase [Rhizobium smilacinae]
MIDFEAARIKMVEHQIRTTDVTSHSVLRAFFSVAREAFVPEKAKPLAYLDADIELSPGRYLMEASPLAKLLQAAEITKDDRVLEIGTGSGYVAALLSRLAGSVTALESDPALAELAAGNLKSLDCQNVDVVTGELTKGHAPNAPYDLIFVNGAVEEVPSALLDQLTEGGRLVAVVGYGNAAQAKILLKEHGAISESSRFNLSVKPLPGFGKIREFVF